MYLQSVSVDLNPRNRQLSGHTSRGDIIRVKNIFLTPSFLGGAQWAASQKPKSQPAYVTLSIEHSIAGAAATDDLTLTINYSTVSKTIVEVAKERPFASSEDFLHHALERCFAEHAQVHVITIEIARPKALLQPASTTVVAHGIRGTPYRLQKYSITQLESSPIVGVNDCEREQAQLVRFDVSWAPKKVEFSQDRSFPIRRLAEKLTSVYITLICITTSAKISAGYFEN